MTVRRYYTDSYTTAFRPTVVSTPETAAGPAAVLDETFFYPTSGGQPHDTGTLAGARVLDVQVGGDGTVTHTLDAPVQTGPVDAAIDWTRRFDHMQQHTGQHILSQAFIRVADADTTSFHLGTEGVSIDLGVPAIADAKVAEALAVANQIVAGNAGVRAWFPDDAERAGLKLRKTPEVEGKFRVVAIGDFDLSACGGTHVAATGEVGLIEILKTERQNKGIRIEFLCGGRARSDYAAKHGLLQELARSLTCSPGEVPASVARIQQELSDARRALAGYRDKELDAEAAALLAGGRRIQRAFPERPIAEVKELMLRVTSGPGVVALFGVPGPKTQLLFGKSEDVTRNLKPAFDAALAALGGGKGGGSRLLQGAAGPSDAATLDRVLADAAGITG